MRSNMMPDCLLLIILGLLTSRLSACAVGGPVESTSSSSEPKEVTGIEDPGAPGGSTTETVPGVHGGSSAVTVDSGPQGGSSPETGTRGPTVKKWTESYEVSPPEPPPINVTLTADNWILEFCVDGVSYMSKLNHPKNWIEQDTVQIPGDTKVVGIRAQNIDKLGNWKSGNRAGIIAKFSNGIVTDDNWKCSDASDTEITDLEWCTQQYDDIAWGKAKIIGDMRLKIWKDEYVKKGGRGLEGLMAQATNAKFIWWATPSHLQVRRNGYCRYTFAD